MFNTLVSILPLIIGSAVVPVQIIIAILLLTSAKQGLAKAIAFVAGMTLVRLAQGVIFGFIFTGGSPDTAGRGRESGWIVPTLMLVLAILMLITAYRQWAKDPDPDAPPPKWLALPEKLTPLTALALGAGMILIAAKMWVFTLGAIGTIGAAQLGQPAGRHHLSAVRVAGRIAVHHPDPHRAHRPGEGDRPARRCGRRAGKSTTARSSRSCRLSSACSSCTKVQQGYSNV